MAIVYSEESYAIMGACFEVYKQKGCGFLESVYQECLEMELDHRKIPFQVHPTLWVSYRGHPLKSTFVPDLVCFNKIIVELKAVSDLCEQHRAQLYNYLKATGFKLGILVNFGHYPKLQSQRIVS